MFVHDQASDPLCAPDNHHYDMPAALTVGGGRWPIEVADVIVERLTAGRWEGVTSRSFSIGESP